MSERKNWSLKMLRIIVNNAASSAKSYYATGLSKDDYYTKEKDTEIIGKWGGNGAELLGLKGMVTQDDFSKLCDNINPLTGEQLTARNVENRRVGYDLNFHSPKSVSIIYAITKDKNILESFRAAVNETMLELEKDMQTRVRKAGQFDSRTTGNLIYGEFIHTTSRPVDGTPDPHLHAHCFTFNATYDQKEQQWKAGEFGKIKKDASYFEAYFHSKFAHNLKTAGYSIEHTKKGWEIGGFDRSTIEKFSRRTTEIEELAKAKGVVSAKEKDKLGAKTRKGKDKILSSEDLQNLWSGRLSSAEHDKVINSKGNSANNVTKLPSHYINLGIEHIMERKSVSSEREVLKHALKNALGKYSPEKILEAFSNNTMIKGQIGNQQYLTTKEAITEERNLIRLAVESKGKFASLSKDHQLSNPNYTKDQKQAVNHILTSKDGCILVEGGAGTGKTTFLKEIKQVIEKKGKPFMALAPSADASRGVLESEGFQGAETVAKFLNDKKMQAKARNGFIWIDEGGQLGNKSMLRVLEIAQQQNARLIVTGDTRQHNSVERGDAMRLLIEKAKINTVRTNQILRQVKEGYRTAVYSISQKAFDKAFKKLDEIGAIQEVQDSAERYLNIAEDYSKTLKANKSVLVVSPTHAESGIVTDFIRSKLKMDKLLGKKDYPFTIQKNLSPTEAEKKDLGFYQVGMSLQFNQNVKGFKRGSAYDIVGKNQESLILSNGERNLQFSIANTDKFNVYEKHDITLSKGDSIRISQNGFSENKKRLNNGSRLTVSGFDKAGNIIANTGNQDVIIGKNYRNFTYGYCSTSYSSQGKTVHKIIIAQSSFSSGAASQEQFYVSASRGKSDIAIYTNDKEELKRSVTSSSQRINATDIIKEVKLAPDRLKRQQTLVSRLAALNNAWAERTAIRTTKMSIRR